MVRKYKFSPMWNYFREDANCNSRAKCNLCGRDISFKGGSTFNLTRHLRLVHPGIIKDSARKKVIRTTVITEPDGIEGEIEEIQPIKKEVCVSELVFDEPSNDETADADITWAQPEPREPEPREPDSREPEPREPEPNRKPEPKEPNPKKLRQNPMEHFRPAISDLVPYRDMKRPSRERSSVEHKSSETYQNQTSNPMDNHFQNSMEDSIEIFGKSVVAQLRLLPKRQAITTQLKIQAILTEQLLEFEDSRF